MSRSSTAALLAACLLLLAVSAAQAQCTVSVTPIVFGNYDVLSPTARDSTGTVSFECSKWDKKIRVTLTKGSSPSYSRRRMSNGTDALEYNLFLDAFDTIWGDGTGGTHFYHDNNPPNDQRVDIPVYGRIFPLQDVSAGLYVDNVQVQIDF